MSDSLLTATAPPTRTEQAGPLIVTGIQAISRLVVEVMRADERAGHHTAALVCGYPGSPLGGLDLDLQRQRSLLDAHRIRHLPALNEDLAVTAIVGSQVAGTFPRPRYDGVTGFWYGKAPGLERSYDALHHAQYAGTAPLGGAVALVGDDPASKSSDMPYDSIPTLVGLDIPTLVPAAVAEILDLGLHAVALSRYTGVWSALKIVTGVADALATVDPSADRELPPPPDERSAPLPTGLMAGPTVTAAELDVTVDRVEAARRYLVSSNLNDVVEDTPDAVVGVVAVGHAFPAVEAALDRIVGPRHAGRSRRVRVLRVRMVHPLDGAVFRRFAQGLDEIVVVEEKRPHVERFLREALYRQPASPVIVGKRDDAGRALVPGHGVLDAESVEPLLRRRLAHHLGADTLLRERSPRRLIEVMPAHREPYFCSGCPHSTSTVVPAGSLVGAGTGCHGLIVFRDRSVAGPEVGNVMGVSQMGGEGMIWVGAEPFVDDDHLIQNIGDGTYFHSGQLAVQAAVAAGTHITFKLLYNGAVAMTGGQSPTMSNATRPDELAAILVRQGVRRVIITSSHPGDVPRKHLPKEATVWSRDRMVEAQETLRQVDGVTAIIHVDECATELRRKRKRGTAPAVRHRIAINDRVCEGCGDCGAVSNCLSVQPIDTDHGRKTTIDQTTCNDDQSCMKGDCPSFLILEPARKRRRRRAASAPLDPADLPDPHRPLEGRWRLRIPGIGGTGVITVNQIIATAANLDHLHAVGSDQTGLSQKAGPVVSDLLLSSDPLGSTDTPATEPVGLLLACDLMVAANPAHASTLTESTVLVASTSDVPNGAMVTDPAAPRPSAADYLSRLTSAVTPARVLTVDALTLTRSLFGTAATANVLLLGVAYQAGAVPVTAGALERAIEINGVAVDDNVRAFRWGRLWAHDPARLARAATTSRPIDTATTAPSCAVPESLARSPIGALVTDRAAELTRYQNERYARRYVEFVERAHDADAALGTDRLAFADGVARNLYKLMAYKDEYEVARLHLDAGARARALGDWEGARVQVLLQPPLLRSLGLDRKIRCGRWIEPVFRSLIALRRVRGTPLDPFGHAKVRRLERGLVVEYQRAIGELIERLPTVDYDAAVELARLPDIVRGYEHIKLRSVEQYRARLDELRRRLEM